MDNEKSDFEKVLTSGFTERIPLYCTGFPETDFIQKYIQTYNIKPKKDKNLILDKKDYSIIEQMGFDAISIWDFRRGPGGYKLNDELEVDGWGRIYKGSWYQNDGVFKDNRVLERWEHLNFPLAKDLGILKNFLKSMGYNLIPILSLPGLFEKTWQSMGLLHFSRCLRRNQAFIELVIDFFLDYLKKLIISLQKAGAEIFLIADDCGYKTREFIPKEKWKELFFNKYESIVDLIHKENNLIIFHSDGNISNLIEVFIDIGFNAIQSLESASGIDIISLFQRYKNKITFIGNLDLSDLIYKKPEFIKSYVEKLIINAKKNNSRLVISPTQQINSKVKPENIKAMIEATKTYFK